MSKKDPIEAKLTKCPTGIQGLNEITDGGLPKGRPTVLCGTAESKVMPLSAIEACEVDYVLPLEEIGEMLKLNVGYWKVKHDACWSNAASGSASSP